MEALHSILLAKVYKQNIYMGKIHFAKKIPM
jgi:hypothetical protein